MTDIDLSHSVISSPPVKFPIRAGGKIADYPQSLFPIACVNEHPIRAEGTR